VGLIIGHQDAAMGMGDGRDEQIGIIQTSAFALKVGLPTAKELDDVVRRVERLERLVESLKDPEILLTTLGLPGSVRELAGRDDRDPHLLTSRLEEALLDRAISLQPEDAGIGIEHESGHA